MTTTCPPWEIPKASCSARLQACRTALRARTGGSMCEPHGPQCADAGARRRCRLPMAKRVKTGHVQNTHFTARPGTDAAPRLRSVVQIAGRACATSQDIAVAGVVIAPTYKGEVRNPAVKVPTTVPTRGSCRTGALKSASARGSGKVNAHAGTTGFVIQMHRGATTNWSAHGGTRAVHVTLESKMATPRRSATMGVYCHQSQVCPAKRGTRSRPVRVVRGCVCPGIGFPPGSSASRLCASPVSAL